jgi:single-stranded DNA-specific DHH superfamily exonuclease
MFDLSLSELWGNYSFEICIGAIVVFILCLAIYRKIRGKKGTWSNPMKDRRDPRAGDVFVADGKKDSKGEKECRRVLEKIFGRPFGKARPQWLKNPVTGFSLEIDCFNNDLKLGLEFQGIFHSVHTPFFNKTKDSFQNVQYRDAIKKMICAQHGVKLIEVPHTVELKDIEAYIRAKLTELGY